MSATRRLAAILAADVVGYSRLMGADEEGTLERLKAHRRQLVDPKIQEHHGRIVKTTGDGVLVEFASVVDAVRCAAEIQRAMVDRDTEIVEDRRMKFRVGINLGDIIVDHDDLFGDGVNVAARLEPLAEPGGICISGTLRDHVGDRLPYAFEDMGEQRLKNIARPVRVYAMSARAVASLPQVPAPAHPTSVSRGIAARGAGLDGGRLGGSRTRPTTEPWTTPAEPAAAATGRLRPPLVANTKFAGKLATPSTAPRLSMVVLPFANLSNDPEQEFFTDGITDDLTTDLSRIADSFVIARTTAFTYKGKPADVKQIGRELGVRYVLEGSVRRTGDQVRVNVQLIDAESGAHLWADRFETGRASLAEAQNEIIGRLARTLNVELVEDVGRRMEQERAVNPEARDLVMHGWAWFDRPSTQGTYQEAWQAFERALEIDPGSVDARIGIGTVLSAKLIIGWSTSSEAHKARADRLLTEALERDANRSMAHFGMGLLRRFQNRMVESQIELETAIALDRNNVRALRQLGSTLMFMGRPEPAIDHMERAMRLSPRDPYLYLNYFNLGACHLLLGHVEESIDLLRKARAANPRPYFVHLYLAGALGLCGALDEARAALAEAIRLNPEVSSLARMRTYFAYITNSQHWALREETVNVGLRRAGLPDE